METLIRIRRRSDMAFASYIPRLSPFSRPVNLTSGLRSRRHTSPQSVSARQPQRQCMMSQTDDDQFRIKNRTSSDTWVKAYKAYLARDGEQACKAAIEGYSKLGRGAVFVVDDNDNMSVFRGGDFQQADGVAVMYVAMNALEQKSKAGGDDVEPILNRMRIYDPTKQFVIVFEVQSGMGRMQGADIVTPKKMPDRKQS